MKAIIAMIFAAATAVKQDAEQISAMSDSVQRATYFGNDNVQTRYNRDYSIQNLDEVNENIKNWFDQSARPFFESHRDEVMRAAYANYQE